MVRPLLPIVLALLGTCGCSAWPFRQVERTTHITPAQRIAEIESVAAHATGTDSVAQQEHTAQLASKIQTEPDPLVREAIIRAVSRFRTPMSQRVLEAGLADEDASVRIACCKALGQHGEVQSAASLGRVLRDDSDLDVRLAATRALGQLRSAAVPELLAALDDGDPALQYAGVNALRTATGEQLGRDVSAWRQYVVARLPTGNRGTSVASAQLLSDRQSR